MLRELQRRWRDLKSFPVGERFQTYYREQRQRGSSPLWRIVSLVAAIALIGVGVVFVFIPGPAIVFFALGGGLLASHSLAVARALDWSELRGRAALHQLRRWWRARTTTQRVAIVLVAVVSVVGIALAALELFTGVLSR